MNATPNIPTPERCARYGWATQSIRGAVLDAGCGDGWGTALLAPHADHATGVNGDLTDLPYDDHSFDTVVCFETLTQIRDADRALDELCRVLAPEGLLVISAPQELAQDLQARFVNVATYRQHNYLASLVCDDQTLQQHDPTQPLPTPQTTKTTPTTPGHELHTIAIATNGPPPTPTAPQLALGPPNNNNDELDAWRDRAVHAEIETAIVGTERFWQRHWLNAQIARATTDEEQAVDRLERLERDRDRARASAHAIEMSASWRLTTPLRRARRLLAGPARRT